MHLYVIAKGHKDSLNRWENDLLAQFLPTYKNGKKVSLGKTKDGKDIIEHRRLSIRPVQLYEIGFAEEELEKVLGMVCPQNYVENRYKVIKKGLSFLRKILGLKTAPEPKSINPLLQPNLVDKAVAVIPIGLKKDMFSDDGVEQI